MWRHLASLRTDERLPWVNCELIFRVIRDSDQQNVAGLGIDDGGDDGDDDGRCLSLSLLRGDVQSRY